MTTMTTRKIMCTIAVVGSLVLFLSLASIRAHPRPPSSPTHPPVTDRRCVPIGGMLMTERSARTLTQH